GGIAYVNLQGMPTETMTALIPELVKARGVIFDLRGYPRDRSFLGHLMETPDDYQGWMRVMLARAPDGDLNVGAAYEWGSWPARPRIESPAVLLTNHRALSYAESIVGMVKYHELATVVGSNTGGANGNILWLHLPGGYIVRYTGMHVLGPDGKPFHASGIEPDIHVVPTIEGLKDGRDEVLERALQLFE
ncbi:MAG: S41 family peptidase, partial [Wenzhouxiangellaceae bacterium]